MLVAFNKFSDAGEILMKVLLHANYCSTLITEK